MTAFARSSRSEERRVGKGWRWTGDWSSDVCSSDLGFGDEVAHDDASLAPHTAFFAELEAPRGVSNDEPSESLVADEDVRTESEDEVGQTGVARGDDRVCEIVEIGRASCRERVEVDG